MYDASFEHVPDHPRLKRMEDSNLTALASLKKFKLVKRFLHKSTIFVEFAPGDCRFAMDICNHVKFVYGVDISTKWGTLIECRII